MIFGYHNLLLMLWLALLKAEELSVNKTCSVRFQSNLTLELNRESTNVRQAYLVKDKQQIASSRNVKDGWNEIDEKYKARLLLSVMENGYLTIHLQNVTTEDKGIYITTVIFQNGASRDEYWDIKIKDIDFEISVRARKNGTFFCKCGNFTENEIPRLSFLWNITNHNSQALNCPKNISVKCSVTGPMEGCPHLNQTWTTEHRGKTCSRKKRSTEGCTECTPANSTFTEPEDTGTTDNREHPSTVNSVAIAVPVAVVVIIIIATVVVCVYRYRRRKNSGKKNQSESEAEEIPLGQKDKEEETKNE